MFREATSQMSGCCADIARFTTWTCNLIHDVASHHTRHRGFQNNSVFLSLVVMDFGYGGPIVLIINGMYGIN